MVVGIGNTVAERDDFHGLGKAVQGQDLVHFGGGNFSIMGHFRTIQWLNICKLR
jgi:hypothetical protein